MGEQQVVRCGVVGAGGFAEVCHIPGLQQHARARVVALCGRRQAHARAMADRFGIPDVFTDYRELVTRADLDAVTIATPDVAHYDIAMAALRAGKHVFCEKPLTMTVDQARALVAEAERARVVNMVAFTFRYTHAVEQLASLVASGAIGQPTYVSMEVHSPAAMNPEGTAAWRNYADDSTAGILGDMGVHFFDVVQHVLSPITSIAAITARLPRVARDRTTGQQRQTDALDLTTCLIRTSYPAPTRPPVVQGHIITSWMTLPRGHNGNVHIAGTQGALNATLGRGAHEQLEQYRPGTGWEPVGLPADAASDDPKALGRMMGAFVDAVLRGAPDGQRDATFLDGLRTQLALDAAMRSADSDQWEPVPKQ